MNSEVREGFLCPICMTDLKDEIQLTVHFEEKHSREDPAIVQNFKDLFSKAKKIINKDQSSVSTPSGQNNGTIQDQIVQEDFSREFYGLEPSLYHPVSGIHYDILDENDSKVQVFDKFDQFRLERAKRADIRAMDINKLIVRLEKLMTQLPSDPVKRRNHEQSIVPWINEKDVALCPGCAKSFGITRRKHHCRLCGGVMCADCSELVSFELAERLINPATISKFNQTDGPKSSPSKSKAQATYDGLVSNLVDLAGFAEAQRNFRSCLLCKEVLDKRDHRLSIKTAPDPQLVKYYTHLQKLLTQGEEMSQKYRKMANSLNNGESTYKIDETQVLRLQVMKAAETVEAVSKKIAALPPEDAKSETLQNRIRIAAVNFVKETLVGLPSAPTVEEFEVIKKQKAEEANKRIEEEKRSAQEAKIKSESMKKQQQLNNSLNQASSMISNAVSTSKRQLKFPVSSGNGSSSSGHSRKGSDVKLLGQGFVASAVQETIDDDPLGQQIYNLKKYIQQAKAAGHFDDARILENNLKDLQEEYRKVKTDEQVELQQNYEEFKGLFSKSVEEDSEELDESNPFYDAEEQLDGTNPFKDDDESDKYDQSGKSPFG